MNKKNIVLITGCGSGIGRSLALEFNKRGNIVIATDQNENALKDLKSSELLVKQLDVTDESQIKKVIDEINQLYGRLDILINNAGYAEIGPTVELTDSQILNQFKINTIAPVQITRHALPLLKQSVNAKVINIGSVSGILTTPFAGVYCASKSALHSLSDALRMELAPFKIQVITVQPAGIKSDFSKNASERLRKIFSDKSKYYRIQEAILARANASQDNAMNTSRFAEILTGKILKKHTSSIIRLGTGRYLLPLLKQWVKQSILDKYLSGKFRLNQLSKSQIIYPSRIEKRLPIFPSPLPWFKWKQRYIYQIRNSNEYTYMNGYGEFHKDIQKKKPDRTYKMNTWLKSIEPQRVSAMHPMRIYPYKTDFEPDTEGLTWVTLGLQGKNFNTEMINFDYPLILGKRFYGTSTVRGVIPVSLEGIVIAFIPFNIKDTDDISIAPGHNYDLPIDIDEIPGPLNEVSKINNDNSWTTLQSMLNRDEAMTDWNNVKVPAGKRKGEIIKGYYVIKITTRVFGKITNVHELWKDVRGCVPFYKVEENFPQVLFARETIKIARVWSGNVG